MAPLQWSLLATSWAVSTSAFFLARPAPNSTSPPSTPRLRSAGVNATAVVAASAVGRHVSQHARSRCVAGDNVYALYGGDGGWYSATIRHVDGDGTATVDWYNEDPWHRTIDLTNVRKNGIACAGPQSNSEPSEHKNAPPAPPAPPPPPGVVNFLFMLGDQLPHQDLWRKFFAGAPQGSWRAFVHCKDEKACQSLPIDIAGFTQVPTKETWYCHDLVTAMAQLLSSALEESKADARPGPEKFVFVSDSTLPVKPFHELHKALVADDDSDFCLFPEHQWGSATIDGHDVRLVKHHQWVVLNKEHAQYFVKEWVPVTERGVWQVWLKTGTWKDKVRFVSPQHFYHPPATNWCTDEWAFMATIFGAIEPSMTSLPGFGGGAFALSGPKSFTTQGRCRTFTFWDTADGDPFAPLATAVHSDYNSQMSCYPRCYQRPATFGEVSGQGLSAMRHSPFLFVRKFSPWTDLKSFETVILR